MKLDQDSARKAILNARQAMQHGDRQAAHDWALRAVALDPDSEEPWLYLAAVSAPRVSLRCLVQALKINPGSQSARQGMQWAEERLRREQARQCLEQDTQPIRTLVDYSGSINITQNGLTSPAITEPQSQPQMPVESVQMVSLSVPTGQEGIPRTVARSRWSRSIKRLSSHWQNWIGVLLVSMFILIAITAPWISPNTANASGPFILVKGLSAGAQEPNPPGSGALLGTLPGQFDVFHALVWGTQGALIFGLEVVILTATIGLLVGAIAGYAGGLVSSVMMRITDAFLAFPVIAGVVFINQLWFAAMVAAGGLYAAFRNEWYQQPTGPVSGILNLFEKINPLVAILILFSWMPYARITNAVVTTLKQSEFIQAARAIGARSSRIIFRHLIPNSVTPSIVLAARDVGSMVILQATFTFIGLDGTSTWGQILVMGKDWVLGPGGGIFKYWWVYIPATLALILFGIGWNLLGDGLSELLDPHDE